MIGMGHGDCRVVPLDDFLLKIEEMERGGVSPDFDSLWDNSLVVIAPPGDAATATLIASLRERLAPTRFPVIAQALLALLWIVVVILFPHLLSRMGRFAEGPFRILLPVAMIVASVLVSVMAFSHGVILPLIPAVIVSLFLMIFPGSRS